MISLKLSELIKMDDQQNAKQAEQEYNHVTNLINIGKDLIVIRTKINHLDQEAEKLQKIINEIETDPIINKKMFYFNEGAEKLRKSIDIFELELRQVCPIVPGRRHLANVSNAEFKAAIWFLERQSRIAQYSSPLNAYEILNESQQSGNYIDVVCDAALILSVSPISLILDTNTWKLIAQSMSERAKCLLDYMNTPCKKPTLFIGEITVKGELVPWEEHRLKMALDFKANYTSFIKYTNYIMVVSSICGSKIEESFLSKIYPSPEFQKLGLSPLPTLEDGHWIEGLQKQRAW